MTIYIISGPPGAGKSTVCNKLMQRFPNGFHLQCDDIYNMVKGGYKAPWDDNDDRLKNLMFEGAHKLIETYAAAKFYVAVDYVFSLAQLQFFIAKISEPIVLSILLPSLKANLSRDQNRKWVVGENLVANYHSEFANIKSLSPYFIDTTAMAVDEVVEEILKLNSQSSTDLLKQLRIL